MAMSAKQEEIRVRLSAEEKEILKGAARRASLTVSGWLRMMALRLARHEEHTLRVTEVAALPNFQQLEKEPE
jgi:uncharacterized protein (DUF1778 family)